MSGSVVRKGLTLEAFADITDAVPTIARDGVTFDGDLTPAQVADVWWRMTSRDDVDEARRRALSVRRDDPETCACCVEVIGYLLGEDN